MWEYCSRRVFPGKKPRRVRLSITEQHEVEAHWALLLPGNQSKPSKITPPKGFWDPPPSNHSILNLPNQSYPDTWCFLPQPPCFRYHCTSTSLTHVHAPLLLSQHALLLFFVFKYRWRRKRWGRRQVWRRRTRKMGQ